MTRLIIKISMTNNYPICSRNSAQVIHQASSTHTGTWTRSNSAHCLRQGYQNWLSRYSFEWFITLTFQFPDTSEYKGRKMMANLVSKTEECMFGLRMGQTPHQKLSMAVFEERNHSCGLHYHCMVQPPTDLGCLQTSADLPKLIYLNWKKLGGGVQFNCQPIHNQNGVVSLLSYLTKQIRINRDCVHLNWFEKR